MPPRIKVLEAISSISAGRVKKEDAGIYKVRSSKGDKEYIVIIKTAWLTATTTEPYSKVT